MYFQIACLREENSEKIREADVRASREQFSLTFHSLSPSHVRTAI